MSDTATSTASSPPAMSTVSLGRIGQVHVTVKDLARATRFYRESLGIPFLFEVPNMSFFDCEGTRLMLGVTETPGGASHASVLYFRVEDIQGAHTALAGRGVRFEGAPHIVAKLADHDLWMAFFRDTEDNLMALMSEVQGGR